jgi:long-chain acyl-CoA synthetase
MYEAQKEKDWRYIIEDSGAKVVFVATEKIYHIIKEFIGKVGNVTAVVCFDAPAEAPHSYQR